MSEPEDVGSLAEEAVKLVEALLSDDEYAQHATTCTWCPVCQLVNAVRSNPALVEQFVGGLMLLLRAGRAFLESAGQGSETRP